MATDDRAGLRVLLVDDDADMARLLEQILRAHGFASLVHVQNSTAALAAAANADLVLLDHQLPDGTGIEVIEAIRNHPGKPSVIIVTAHGNESLAAAALRRGADDYLVKDGSLAELLPQVVERVRRGRALRTALETAERELMRAERMAAIGELTVTLHHEINNPLMSATAEIELLLAGADPRTPEQRDGMQTVQRSLARIRDIIKRTGELRQSATVEYRGGVRMIDLNAEAEAPAGVQRGTAAVHLPDEELARVTESLLRQAGFRVQRCRTITELDTWGRTVGTALIVLAGATAPGADPLAGLHPAADRDYRLVVLGALDPAAAMAAGADRVVALPFDPGTFVADLFPTAATG